MKLPKPTLLLCVVAIVPLLASPVERVFGTTTPNQSAGPGWPLVKSSNGNRLIGSADSEEAAASGADDDMNVLNLVLYFPKK